MGDSMIGAGIHNGDLLVVDRSRTPASGKVVVAIVDGELTIKRFSGPWWIASRSTALVSGFFDLIWPISR